MHLAYVRERTGHPLIGARQWIPAEHIHDPVKSLVSKADVLVAGVETLARARAVHPPARQPHRGHRIGAGQRAVRSAATQADATSVSAGALNLANVDLPRGRDRTLGAAGVSANPQQRVRSSWVSCSGVAALLTVPLPTSTLAPGRKAS